jgi:predicted ester cyclase
MSTEQNKAVVLRFIEEVQNQHHLDVIDEVYSPNFINHNAQAGQAGIEGTKAFFGMMFAAFPDMHFTVNMMVAEGDLVATYKTFHGTQLGVFMGTPPTGRQVTVDVMDILAVHEGKITDHWTVDDSLGMLRQLGLIPEPG